MPPRLRRPWSDIRAEIRRMIFETVAAESAWSDQLVLDAFNACKDRRELQLTNQHEGWSTEAIVTDVTAGENEYPLPENTGRVKRVLCASATDLGREPYFQGHGLVDVLRAIQSV